MSEEPFSLQVVGNLFMVSEFSAIVVSQGEDAILMGFQVVTDRIRNSLRCFIGSLDRNAKSRFTLNKRHKGVVRQSLTRLKVPRSHKSMKRRFETTL